MGESGLKLSAVSVVEMEPVRADAEDVGSNSEVLSELTSYLTTLGLDDAHLAEVVSLMQATHGENGSLAEIEEHINSKEESPPSPATNGRQDQPGPSGDTKTVKLFLAEEQPIQLQAYQTFLKTQSNIGLVGCTSDTSSEAMVDAVTTFEPDVVLMGVKALRTSTVEKLEALRDAHPNLAVVLLFAFYDTQGIKALRDFSNSASAGYAYLLKHNVDTANQLAQVVHAVAQGRIIVDPQIMEELVDDASIDSKVLTALSPKELQVLSWMARGYANDAIANVLSRDRKSVKRHVSSIYTKLQLGDGNRDSRVGAALMYLTATGMLPRG